MSLYRKYQKEPREENKKEENRKEENRKEENKLIRKAENKLDRKLAKKIDKKIVKENIKGTQKSRKASGRIYTVGGVFGVLLAVIMLLLWSGGQASAATPDKANLDGLTLSEWPLGDGSTIGGFTCTGAATYGGSGKEYMLNIETEAQLKSVLSGVPAIIEAGGKTYDRTGKFRFIFYLTKDMELNLTGWSKDAEVEVISGGTYKVKDNTSSFEHCELRGSGHTIKIKGSSDMSVTNTSDTATIHNYGMLFARINDSKIENLRIRVPSATIRYKQSDTKPDKSDNAANDSYNFGVLCGSITGGSVIRDVSIEPVSDADCIAIEIEGTNSTTLTAQHQLGFGSAAGAMETSSRISTVKSALNFNITGKVYVRSGDKGSMIIAGCGGIAGQVIGKDNEIEYCYYTGEMEASSVGSTGTSKIHRDAILMGGMLGLVGDTNLKDTVRITAGVTINNICAVTSAPVVSGSTTATYFRTAANYIVGARKGREEGGGSGSGAGTVTMAGTMYGGLGGGKETIVRLHDKKSDTWQLYEPTTGDRITYTMNKLTGRTSVLGTNWRYHADNDMHMLSWMGELTRDISFYPPILGDTDEDGNIVISAEIGNWSAQGATTTAELYVTRDGTDPMDATPIASLVRSTDTEGIFEHTIDYEQEETIRARVKVVKNPGKATEEATEEVYWSEVAKRSYSDKDVAVKKPVLSMQQEQESDFSVFDPARAYLLGTTKMQLTPAQGKDYDIYYHFGSKSGMILGSSDSDTAGTISLQTMRKNKYASALTLTKDMIKNQAVSSNRVYMYVLAQKTVDGELIYALYEYTIIVLDSSGLISISPSNANRIPSGSTLSVKVGNGKVEELPFSSFRMLISSDKKSLLTLDGQTGVKLCTNKITTAGEAWYATGEDMISGSPGSTYYVYIEPIVNVDEGYDQNYGSFIQEYVYILMDRPQRLVLSPMTSVKTEQAAVTDIAINESIYMITGNSDIVVYDKTGTNITPSIVTDADIIDGLNTDTALQTMGYNAYVKDDTEGAQKIYVRSNGIWYVMNNQSGNLDVYQAGSLSYGAEYANKKVYLSTRLFAYGYEVSLNDVFVYQVKSQEAIAAPTSVLTDGSIIPMEKILYFNSITNSRIYYTVDGTVPDISVGDDGEIDLKGNTQLYDSASGIGIHQADGYQYGDTITIKMFACPVTINGDGDTIYDKNKGKSATVTFNYTIREKNQVSNPTAYPQTDNAAPSLVSMGEKIIISSATAGADIYYTTDGSMPTKSSTLYQDGIVVEGDFGGYFTIKAIAYMDEMKDSAEVTFVYKINLQEIAGAVSAIPNTSTKVIAGDKILLSTTTAGAAIYYTVDGTAPEVSEDSNGNFVVTGSARLYQSESGITVPEGSGYFLVSAVAIAAGTGSSEVSQFAYAYVGSVGVPYGNPSPGTVEENTQVLLQCANKDAVIYYEIAYGGNTPKTPTTSSAVFSDKAPIVITRDTTIKAFATYERGSSETVTLTYTLAQKLAIPVSAASSGSIVPSGTTVTFSGSSGKIYYTTDGSDPTDSKNTSTQSGDSVVITGKAGDVVVVKACARQTGATTSDLATFTYQISQYPGGVSADVESGEVLAGGSILHLTTDVTGGEIYYTTQSGNPVSEGAVGSTVTINGEPGDNVMVKAVAVAPSTTMNGSYALFNYRLMEQLASPSASVKDGSVLTEKTSVTLKANKGKIYFTIDGSIPTKASNEYSAPIVVSKDMKIRAVAIEQDYVDSKISEFDYSFAEKVKPLRTQTKAGIIDSGQIIKLTTDTPGAAIYYTTNGEDPDTKGEETFLYDEEEGIRIYRSVTLKAVAGKDGMCNSDVLELNYIVEQVPNEEKRRMEEEEREAAGLKELDAHSLEERRKQAIDGLQYKDVIARDMTSGAVLGGNTGVVPEDLTLVSKQIAVPSQGSQVLKDLLGTEYEFLANYDFTIYANGEKIQPTGMVEIGIPIPEEYENADIMIVFINDNGGITPMETRRDGSYVYAQVSHFSSYAIVGAHVDEVGRRGLNMIVILMLLAGVMGAGGVTMIVRLVKKKKHPTGNDYPKEW